MMNSIRKMTGLVLALMMVAVSPVALAGDIYRVVDKDGNVVYTDQPPHPGAEPVNLRELSVVERPEYAPTKSEREAEEDDQGPSLSDLRRMYRDFRIVSPAQEQAFWGTGNRATIAWETRSALQPGMNVQVYIDDQPFGAPSRQSVMTTEQLDRGQHNVRAEILTAENRVVATAGPVVFFIHQASANRARPQPRGGG